MWLGASVKIHLARRIGQLGQGKVSWCSKACRRKTKRCTLPLGVRGISATNFISLGYA